MYVHIQIRSWVKQLIDIRHPPPCKYICMYNCTYKDKIVSKYIYTHTQIFWVQGLIYLLPSTKSALCIIYLYVHIYLYKYVCAMRVYQVSPRYLSVCLSQHYVCWGTQPAQTCQPVEQFSHVTIYSLVQSIYTTTTTTTLSACRAHLSCDNLLSWSVYIIHNNNNNNNNNIISIYFVKYRLFRLQEHCITMAWQFQQICLSKFCVEQGSVWQVIYFIYLLIDS